ncbi:MAG: SPFH domain-containing protein [Myxococcota bacterium]|jgi:regulator of protease activity HflC (stomatin/prohibitin superfamily)|nr:SPFH domain-containing protein [Myxococcota bacterium]
MEAVFGSTIVLLVVGFALLLVFRGVKVVSQSDVFVIERFGKYTRTLKAGLNFIVPFLDSVAHRISILERQLPEFEISVITRDNVEVVLKSTVFYRVIDAASSVYRIQDVDQAIHTAATSIVRSAAGRLELDELQSSRDAMNQEIETNLREAAAIWGIEVTRTEITDVVVDERTKEAQRQQLNAERKRRADIATAEGTKRSVELAADAQLYQAKKEAEAVRVQAEAKAFAIEAEAKANAEQTRLLANAIADNGQPAINFEVMKRQVDALAQLASSSNSKTVVVPTDVTGVMGSLSLLLEGLTEARG